MEYMIGVYGSAVGGSQESEKARLVGLELAGHGCIVASGGCPGLPYVASMAAKAAGAATVAFSPGRDRHDHLHRIGFPDGFDNYRFLPDLKVADPMAQKKLRNVFNCHEVDAGIILGGQWGSMNEMTLLVDFGKVIGFLDGGEGITRYIPRMYEEATKKTDSVLIVEADPGELVRKVIAELEGRR